LRLVFVLLALGTLSACDSESRVAFERVDVDVNLTPQELPGGAMTLATVTLRDSARRPVRGARLEIKGFMSHPGMAPLVVTVTEKGEGVYVTYLRFSMAGDWNLLITGELPDGQRITSSLKCEVSSLTDQMKVVCRDGS
jgi:hypothetical protein